ncbi:MAG: hypothetical protein IT439_09205 [Phycisphaerales bacterium]|nr:hypothetical protein [Phycisphaerales bacterium]
MAKKGRRRAAGGASLRSLSTSALLAEVRRREQSINSMIRDRDTIAARLASLEDEIATLLGEAPARTSSRGSGKRAGKRARRGSTGRVRPKNDGTLEDALVKTLTDKVMGVNEVAAAVIAAGYKTNAENFRTIVNQCLIRSTRIKKISRGKYTAK